jgi:hypothetical protein
MISYSSLPVGPGIGTGCNEDAFETTFEQGETVAMKQFGSTTNPQSYESEGAAYEYLKKVRGELVPTPKFFTSSPSRNVRLYGDCNGVECQKKTIQIALTNNCNMI